MLTFDEINDRTGFANGIRFENDQEVREYFTVETMRDILGSVPPSDIPTSTDLDVMANTVIEKKWHCAF